MAGTMLDIKSIAKNQLRDYDAHDPGAALGRLGVKLDLDEGYRIQSLICGLRQNRGEVTIGYKVGCNSPMPRRQLGISHSVYGRLYASEAWRSGVTLASDSFRSLAVEGELAVKLAMDLRAGDSAREAIESVFCVIELHNFLFHGEPTVGELTASNAMHAGFVVAGESSRRLHPETENLQIVVDGETVASASGPELSDTVIESLTWLSKELDSVGLDLKAGDTVLCGTVAPLLSVPSVCEVCVSTNHYGNVQCSFSKESDLDFISRQS